MAAGIREVAAAAGVSVGTVSNVLNRPDRVSEQTRGRVLAAIERTGFVRNESARQLRAGSSRLIGMVMLDVSNPFFTDVARGAEAAADEAGLTVILCNSDQRADKETRQLTLLEEQRVLGILLTPVLGTQRRSADLRRRGTPVVLVDRASRSSCSVAVDDVLGASLAVRHLLDHGHQRIAFVGGPRTLGQVADRHGGAVATLVEAGRSRDDLVTIETTGLTVAEGAAAGGRIATLPLRRRPTAAFCANDLLALGLLREMTRRSVRVPQDLAVVGYDDIDFAAAAAVPLSSVRQPREQLGRTATELLIEEVRDGSWHRHRHVVFRPELVVRESSDHVRDGARESSRGAG